MNKNALRTQCLQARKKLSLADQMTASSSVCARILELEQYHQAKHLALYKAVNGEIDLSGLTLLSGQTFYFPVMNSDSTLLFLPVASDTVFVKNRFGIDEPDVKHELATMPEQLDMILLPLVAFDEHGTRLGMGGGYYDRTLANTCLSSSRDLFAGSRDLTTKLDPADKPREDGKPLLIGVAYEFQRQPFIERAPWDVPLAAVITQNTIYWSKP